MSLRHFPLHLMETMKSWSSLHHYIVVFMFLTTVSKACEAPSSPECFRRNADESVYVCEWSMNTTESDVRFDLYFNKTKFRNIKETSSQINEELLIKYRPVYIWVEARAENSSCTSTRRSVVLGHTVKYETPRNISTSWLKNNLNLSWMAAEKHAALAEIWFRRHERPTETWQTLQRTTNTTSDTLTHHIIVLNLLKDSAYQVRIRHRSTQAPNPLWSDWSPVVTVPAELEQKPEVSMTTTLLNGTRKVTLTWKPILHAAAVGGVEYIVEDTQSSAGCPCEKNRHHISTTDNKHTTYVSFSAANISVIGRNAAGFSPPAIVQIPAKPAAGLKICDKMLLDEKLNKKTCLEWYKLQDGESVPGNVITLAGTKKKKDREQIKTKLEDYVGYLHFEHRCQDGKPQTVKICLFYKTEGVPLIKPQDFTAFGETQTSANFSWEAIPSVEQRGFLTHYSLCSVKISLQEEPKGVKSLLFTHL
ncbi:interleukin-12 receptor subunit beta-1 [Centropristis striata]|uniref:interleukin-12 receptor subunit beta-1 n=1 Tax=Centropristis striata TaxID=184440 RepID=UPI0027DEAF21|nr:interleukin-12 receptor subunit beta-1 [Centropristis striata]